MRSPHCVSSLSCLAQSSIPEGTTIMSFRRLLEPRVLAAGILAVINGHLGERGLSLWQVTIAGATIIHASSSTKNREGLYRCRC